jgi:hypothetical protein
VALGLPSDRDVPKFWDVLSEGLDRDDIRELAHAHLRDRFAYYMNNCVRPDTVVIVISRSSWKAVQNVCVPAHAAQRPVGPESATLT